MKPHFWDQGCLVLAERDPVLRAIIHRHGAAHLISRSDPFQALARAIVGQQISVKAAQAIWERFVLACGEVTPQRVGRMRASRAKSCGLSQRKVEYVKDLATRFRSREVDPMLWNDLDDQAIVEQLVAVRGIGRWTAEMFLIFNLLRPDVFPVDDLGLLKALGVAYEDGDKVTRERAIELSEPWRPWRTVATWHLWRSLDPVPVEY
jgi:DNA-3-methyladenine glycosylase II